MRVLSLFDGISCGRVALEKAGFHVSEYYACEIDKYATQVSESNYPDIIRLGDATKWEEWDIQWGRIDLVTAGFPCQAWSLAGKQLGDKDPRGALFWTTLDIIANVLKHNPSAKFIMENVKMKKEFEDYITLHTVEALGYVEKTLINSALVSAQNRNRFYWTNFKVSQPEDKGVLLRDILEDIPMIVPNELGYVFKGGALRGRYNPNGTTEQRLEVRADDKSNALTTVTKDSLVVGSSSVELRPCELLAQGTAGGHVANATDIKGHESIKRVYSGDNKAPTLTTMGGGHREPKVLVNLSSTKEGKSYTLTASYGGAVAWNSCERKQRAMVPVEESEDTDNPNVYRGTLYRKLTPVECERLQTLPDNYTAAVSKRQRYKAIGNGWTVDVISHILKAAFK